MHKYDSRYVDALIISFFILLSAITILPFMNVVTLSLEPEHIASETGVIHLFPREFTLDAYAAVWNHGSIQQAFLNSSFITIIGSALAVVVTAAMAYGLAQREVPLMRMMTFLVLMTMVLKTGIMPQYLLMKNLNLLDSLWSVIFPHVVAAFNLILMKVYFENLPKEMTESAKIDGCSDVGIFFRIILPVSAPIVATIVLFYAVEYWNDYFNSVMYLSSENKKTLQVLLRELLIQGADGGGMDMVQLGKNMRMATAVYAIVPILLVYPFLQKHFTKGILLGAVKG
ncbi:carbohydrate ABC transporter permease [Paenibacillus sp. PL2-23]|uniref:carbohydrate ABC transporter permease n=1 Tax=Paenibacillus sp. PL2-23 TaxID=2100729 RepID=UPI0030F55546